MNNSIFNIKGALLLGAVVLAGFSLNAGNEDRVGSAGASHMLVNPWARSGATAGAGIANVNGLEASFLNIAGVAFTDKTQIKLTIQTGWVLLELVLILLEFLKEFLSQELLQSAFNQ